jgi:hypothetical protein
MLQRERKRMRVILECGLDADASGRDQPDRAAIATAAVVRIESALG